MTMPAQDERDDKGVPFLVAPVRAEDPKRADEDKPKSTENGVNKDTSKADNAKTDSDELVSHSMA